MAASSISTESLAERLQAKEVYEEFCELMFSQRMSYSELLEELEKWGISSSLGALSRFKGSHRGPWALERAKREEREFLTQHGAELDETTRRMVAMRVFQDAASPETSTKDVLRMRDQEIQLAKLKQDAVKLEQAEKKLEQSQQLIDLQKRKIEALEAQAEQAKQAAQRAKDALKGSAGMDEQTRAALIAEMDHLLLGKPKPQAQGGS